jgi:glycosyltransferase involved in cell wall biosynthesis
MLAGVTKLRICRITKRAQPLVGGLEQHVHTLSEIQAGAGHQVTVFTLLGASKATDGSGYQIRMLPGAWLARMFPRELVISATTAITAFFSVMRAHRRQSFDVIHLHGDYFEAALGAVLGKLLGIPAVVTVHAGLNEGSLYQRVAGLAWRRVSQILVHAEEIKPELEALGVDPEHISFSHTAIWADRFDRPGEMTPAMSDTVTIASVGRLHPMKGYRYLVEAAALMPADVPFRLIVAGDGPERAELAALVEQTNSPIEFLGEISNADVPHLLWGADLYVQPSVSLPGQREAKPVAVQEAMAAGLPIVATPSGGIKDMVKDGVNGALVPERDPQALADALTKLMADPSARARIRETNREQGRGYDWSHVARQVEETYKKAGATP